MILIGHVIDQLRTLPEKSVQCVVTSPPYFGLRAYGTDPQVWGGVADCEHEWIDASWRDSRKNDDTAGPKQRSNQGSVGDRVDHKADTCIKCSAWRGELGSEPTIEMFVANIVAVFAEVWRVLRDDGVCWINLGDSYSNDSKWGGSTGGKHVKALHGEAIGRQKKTTGLKEKDRMGIPHRVVFALQAAGWYWRDEIIWHKRSPMPESCTDRTTKAHEYIFMMTKKPRYFYDSVAVKEPCSTLTNPRQASNGIVVPDGWATGKGAHDVVRHSKRTRKLAEVGSGTKTNGSFDAAMAIMPENRNLRSVWSLTSEGYKGAHFACYPSKLVIPCIKAGTSEHGCCPKCLAPWRRITARTARTRERPNELTKRTGQNGTGNHCANTVAGVDVETVGWEPTCNCGITETIPCTVLDPFLGSGTTAAVAEYLGRSWIGCELNVGYADLARQRIAKGYTPPKTKKPKRRKKLAAQRELFQ